MVQSYVAVSVFMLQVVSVYLEFTYIAMAIHIYCKCMFQMFMLHMLQWLYTYVASIYFQIFHQTYVAANMLHVTSTFISRHSVAEPLKLCGPHTPVIVPKASDSYACVSYNLKSLSGVLEKPESSTFYNSHRINKGVITTLHHLIQIFTSECERI
jgi:hypothetical protein